MAHKQISALKPFGISCPIGSHFKYTVCLFLQTDRQAEIILGTSHALSL